MNMFENLIDDLRSLADSYGIGDFVRRIANGDMPTPMEILDFLTGDLISSVGNYYEIFASIIVIVFIASFISEISDKAKDVIEFAASLTVAVVILKSNFFYENDWTLGIDKLSFFIKAFIPIFAAVTALSGNITMSGVYGAASLLCMEIFSVINRVVLTPCINIVLSAGIVSGSAGSGKPGRLLAGFGKLLLYAMSAISALILGIMSMNGFAAHGTDTLMYKTGKFVSGSAIPGIGSTISSSFETAKACFDAAGSIIGVSGMLIILLIVAPYIIRAALILIGASVLSILSDVLNLNKLMLLFDSVKTVCILILSLYALELLVLVSGIALMLIIGG